MTARMSGGQIDVPVVSASSTAVPVAADWSGDLVTGTAQLWQSSLSLAGPVAVRPAGGGPDEPSPATPSAFAVATPGRRIAAAWPVIAAGQGVSALAVSVWRP